MKRLSKKHNDFYSRMLAAKKAKAAKRTKEKEDKKAEQDKPPTEKPNLFSNVPKKEPKRVEVTEQVGAAPDMYDSSKNAIERALKHIEDQARLL